MYHLKTKYIHFQFDCSSISCWDRDTSPLLASHLLLKTVNKHLGNEETSSLSFGRGSLSHFCLIEDSGCSTVLSPLLVSWCAKCLKVLDSRQASSEAMQFSIVLVKYGKAFTEKYVIWMEAYVALKHIYLSAYIPFIDTEASP